MEHLVELRNVSKAFRIGGGFLRAKKYAKAVDNVSFYIDERGIMALVGESGCGKTTTGKLVAGLLKPSEGEVLYRGKNIWNMSKGEYRRYRKAVQIIHQDPYSSLNPMLTVYKSLSAPLFKYGLVSSKEEAVDAVSRLLELVGLTPPEDFIYKYPHQLSGGQRQRVVVARAMSVNPDLVVADEPVSMIDVSMRLQILHLMRDLQEELGVAYLFITHDLATGRYFASKGFTAVMYLGSIVEYGPTNRVVLEPLHPYTRALLSAIPEPDPKLTRGKKVMKLRSLDVPSLLDLPRGCKFHPRCPFYMEGKCNVKAPDKYYVDKDRWVACYLYGDRGES